MNHFYDVKGTYVVGRRTTTIEGMIGVASGAVMGIIEDGRVPIGEITVVGELVETEKGCQLACVLPSSKGQVYGAIAMRKDATEPGLAGKYEGLVFVMSKDASPISQSPFLVAGKIGLHLKLSPPEQGLDN